MSESRWRPKNGVLTRTKCVFSLILHYVCVFHDVHENQYLCEYLLRLTCLRLENTLPVTIGDFLMELKHLQCFFWEYGDRRSSNKVILASKRLLIILLNTIFFQILLAKTRFYRMKLAYAVAQRTHRRALPDLLCIFGGLSIFWWKSCWFYTVQYPVTACLFLWKSRFHMIWQSRIPACCESFRRYFAATRRVNA